MDKGRFSISAADLYARLGRAAAPIVIDARRAPAFEADERMVAPDLAGVFGRRAPSPLRRSRWMILLRALSTAIALLLVIRPIASEAQVSSPIRIDLSKTEPGQEPENFSISRTGRGEAARWIIVDDATASEGRAVAQMSTDRTDYRFPLAVYKPFMGKNLEVKLRFKAVAGTVDEAGGIAVRLSTPDDYYVVRANALEDNVRFYRVVHGKREQLAGADTKVSAKEWHMLGIRAEGERFTISFDGKVLFTTTDKTFADPGKVALWTKADSVTHFDAIEITALP
jgi:hypothetical protein